ncbi:unnamed protein product, partial [Brenthis ino]
MDQSNNENESPPVQNKEQIIAEDGPSRMEVIDLSDEEQELSLAEESVIEECLNDTEGSLSSVDLDFFAPTPKHKRVTKKRLKVLDIAQDFEEDSSLQSISSIEDISDLVSNSNELPVLNDLNINPTSEELEKQLLGDMMQTTAKTSTKEKDANEVRQRKSYAKAFMTVPRISNSSFHTPVMPIRRKRIMRKRRNSPPTKKYDKAHIHSFFSAMADLVVNFPYTEVITAERNVTLILRSMVAKLQEWQNDTSPNKPFRNAINNTDILAIELKLSNPPFLH